MHEYCVYNEIAICVRCGRFSNFPHGKRICDTKPHVQCGPGTELKAIFESIGITSTPDCKCHSRAALMDANGCDWCEANIDEIVGWLRESAAERGLPFLDVAARLLVKRAIANARRKEAARVASEKAIGPHVHPEQ